MRQPHEKMDLPLLSGGLCLAPACFLPVTMERATQRHMPESFRSDLRLYPPPCRDGSRRRAVTRVQNSYLSGTPLFLVGVHASRIPTHAVYCERKYIIFDRVCRAKKLMFPDHDDPSKSRS